MRLFVALAGLSAMAASEEAWASTAAVSPMEETLPPPLSPPASSPPPPPSQPPPPPPPPPAADTADTADTEVEPLDGGGAASSRDWARLAARADAPLEELLSRYTADRFRVEPADGQAEAVAGLAARLAAATWCTAVERDGTSLIVEVSGDAVGRLLPEIVAAGVRVERFERIRPSLEDVFLRLVAAPDHGTVA